MRRSTALMSHLRVQSREGTSLRFENCLGGFFSTDPKYTLKVIGRTQEAAQAGENLFPLGDLEEISLWGDTVIDIDLAEILEPSKTYTISFEAECVERPLETYTCEGCSRWDYETDEEVYESCGELTLYCGCDALGFALVHYDAYYWDYGLGLPENYEHPTVSLFVNKELQQGETYRATVTFTTPVNLQGYTLQCFTNQFYYSHADHPDVHTSTVTFRNIKIDEGEVATPDGSTQCVKAGSQIVCGEQKVTVPCDLHEGDIWYPTTGIVTRHDSVTSPEQYAPQPIVALQGTFDVTQEPVAIQAYLSATLLSKAVGYSNNGWSWQDIQGIVRCGLASKCFRIGDQLTVNRNGIPLVFDIIGIDHDTPTDKHYKHSLTLQMHTLFDTKTAFDTRKALYYAEAGLSAGTFNFTIPSYYETTAGYGGKTYCFTLTKAVPAGGVLEIVWPYGQNLTNTSKCWIKSFESQMATSPIETKVYMTEGSSGNALGVADGNDSLRCLNRIEPARYGHNVWERSTVRQYLNCDTSKGAKWIPYDQFDRPAPWASSSVGGFLYGFEEDFLSVLGEVDKVTAQLKIYGGGTKTTSDRFFLPSAQEVYCGTINRTPEGTAYAYWANNSSLSAPGTKADKSRIKYTNGTAGKWFLRTPHTDSVINEKYFDTTGKMADTSANTEIYISPVCCIV